MASGWPLMVVVGVQDARKDARGSEWHLADGGGRCFRMRAMMPADLRGAWLAVDSGGGGCFGRKSGLAHPILVPLRREMGGQTPRPVAP